MKVRVAIPEEIWRRHDSADLEQEFIDDILLWGMETELDVAFYAKVTDYEFPNHVGTVDVACVSGQCSLLKQKTPLCLR